MIIWAGKSSDDFGIVVEHYPKIIIPRRKREIQQIPGRNEDFIIEQDAFENYDQPYSVFINAKDIGGLPAVVERIVDWLLAPSGYQRLEDSYMPDVYRMAYVNIQSNFGNTFNEYGRGTITFNCAPQKFYKFGERKVELESGQKLYNPSAFKALPLITVKGTGSGSVVFNGKTIAISDIGNEVTIDAKMHRAYNGDTNRISTITGNFEDLVLGKETEISWSGGVTGISVIPRWWTI